jgi:hypothetical protein
MAKNKRGGAADKRAVAERPNQKREKEPAAKSRQPVAAPQPIDELLCQMLETELGGVIVYRTALRCAQNEDLREEWKKYLEQTENHVRIVRELFERRGLDPESEPLGRQIVRHKGQALVSAMETALRYGTPDAAQLVAAECVVDAETKDHANWSLLGQLVEKLPTAQQRAFQDAHAEVEEQEDEHLYHSMGWARELWLQFLGLPAALPPPEERRDVKDAASAARAKQSRKEMLAGRA